MRETLPSVRSDGVPLRRFSTLYTGMKGCTGRRHSTERFVGRRYASRAKRKTWTKFHLSSCSRLTIPNNILTISLCHI